MKKVDKNTRQDLDMALHTMTHPSPKEPTQEGKEPEHDAIKEFHVKRLHDGTFHHVLHDGMNEPQEGSAADLDGVHAALHEHFGDDGVETRER